MSASQCVVCPLTEGTQVHVGRPFHECMAEALAHVLNYLQASNQRAKCAFQIIKNSTSISSGHVYLQSADTALKHALQHEGSLKDSISLLNERIPDWKGPCTEVWLAGSLAYRCLDCQTSNCSSICCTCFEVIFHIISLIQPTITILCYAIDPRDCSRHCRP